MTPRDLRNIHTTENSWKEPTSMREHGTKTTLVFLPADGEASWALIPSLASLVSGGTVQAENTYFRIFKVTGQV